MDNFTGLDAASAHNQLQNFNDMAYEAYNQIYNSVSFFLQDLSKNWASPNAVAFSNGFNEKFTNILSDFSYNIYYAINGCNAAGRALASANGASWSDVTCTLSHDCYFDAKCSETLNGLTGMDIVSVKICRETLKSNLDNGIDTILYMPRSIDFFSTDGSLVSAFSTEIDKVADSIKTACDEEYNLISDYINEETEKIELAKAAAEEAMRNA